MGKFTDWIASRAGKKTDREERSRQTADSGFLVVQLGSDGGIRPTFSAAHDPDLELNEAYASCLQTNATYCSKVEFSSVRIGKDGERIHDYPHLDQLLQVSPNPTMTASVFWERVAYFYFKYNNSIIYKETNPQGEIIALWSLDPSIVEFSRISTGEMVFHFMLNGRDYYAIESELILITRMVVRDLIFGDQTEEAIRRVISLINLNYKGMENAILTSAFIRFIGKSSTKESEERLKEKAKAFTENYLKPNPKNPIGIAFVDSVTDLTPVTSATQKTATYPEANQWNQAVYKYMGCPEKVISGTANEEEMVAYYERTPEVFFMRAAQEMTRKIFTQREYEMGNRIIHSNRSFAYLSMDTRLKIFNAAREIGAFTLGTLGDLLGLPVPSGKRNVVVTSQNYNDSLQGQKATPSEPEQGEGVEDKGVLNNTGGKDDAGNE